MLLSRAISLYKAGLCHYKGCLRHGLRHRGPRLMRIASVGHAAFSVTLIALGITGLIKGDFAPLWQPIPASVGGLAYLCALICLATGTGLLWQRTAPAASRVLLAYLLFWLLLLRVPGILLSPTVDFWWSACQIALMTAAAWVLYVWFADDWDRRRIGLMSRENGLRSARALYGVALIPFGVAHFTYSRIPPSRCQGGCHGIRSGRISRAALHCRGHSGGHGCVCAAGSGTLGSGDGNVSSAGVDTGCYRRLKRRVSME